MRKHAKHYHAKIFQCHATLVLWYACIVPFNFGNIEMEKGLNFDHKNQQRNCLKNKNYHKKEHIYGAFWK